MSKNKCDRNDPQGEQSLFAADCVLPEHSPDQPHENHAGARWTVVEKPQEGHE